MKFGLKTVIMMKIFNKKNVVVAKMVVVVGVKEDVVVVVEIESDLFSIKKVINKIKVLVKFNHLSFVNKKTNTFFNSLKLIYFIIF